MKLVSSLVLLAFLSFAPIFAIGDDLDRSGISNRCFVSRPFGPTLDVSATYNCAPVGGGVVGYAWTRTGC